MCEKILPANCDESMNDKMDEKNIVPNFCK